MKFLNDNPHILAKAIKHFGFDNQLLKLEEELDELRGAIKKYRECGPVAQSHLAEELADVYILSAQIVQYRHLHYLISEWGRAKLKRLEAMIDRGKDQ